MTTSNFIDIVWCSCTIKINRLKRRKRQIWKWFLLNSCFTFSGGLSEHFRWEFLEFDSNRTYFGSAIVTCPVEKLSKFAICGLAELRYRIICISFDLNVHDFSKSSYMIFERAMGSSSDDASKVHKSMNPWYLVGKFIFRFLDWLRNGLKFCWGKW